LTIEPDITFKMNKNIRTTILFVFLLLYGFAISLYSSNVSCSVFSATSCTNSHADGHYFQTSNSILIHTTQFKTAVNFAVNNLTSSSKNSIVDLSVILKTLDNSFLNRFQQYILSSKNILLGYLHTELIFPFHYFW
jgi:hypothetical protein